MKKNLIFFFLLLNFLSINNEVRGFFSLILTRKEALFIDEFSAFAFDNQWNDDHDEIKCVRKRENKRKRVWYIFC